MAAVTAAISAGVALAGVGMNIAQAAKANKDKKAAQGAASAAAAAMKNIKEVNQYAQVQVPTLGFELAQQGIDRSAASALQSAQGAGAEGVVGAAGQIQQAVGASELDLAAQAGDLKLQRDMAQAEAGTGIEQRRALRESDIYSAELTGAQDAAAAAQNAKVAAITGAVEGAGSAVTSLGSMGEAYRQSKSKILKNKIGNYGDVPTAITEQDYNKNAGTALNNPYGWVGLGG
jgi:hypothetical protein